MLEKIFNFVGTNQINMTSADMFKALRKREGVSLVEVGGLVGLAPSSISRFEANLSAPSIHTIENLFDAIGYRLVPIKKEYIS